MNSALTSLPAAEIDTVPYWPSDVEGALDKRITEDISSLKLHGCSVDVNDVRITQILPHWVSGIHRHAHHEVDIILAGHGVMCTPPAQDIRPGTVVFHPSDYPHAWNSGEQGCQVLCIHFSPHPALPFHLPARWPVWPELITDARLLLNEVEESSQDWVERFALRIAVILSRVFSLMEDPEQDAPERTPTVRHIGELDEYLQTHLACPLTLEDIAEKLSISRRTLTRSVRAQTNGSVMQRLHTMRMSRAAELLWQTELPLTEVAEQVGFTQQSYFCRCFQQYFHCTPARYRAQMLQSRVRVFNLYCREA